MKAKTLKAPVLYYDVFEYPSFPAAVWSSTRNHKLLHRFILVGAAAKLEKHRGPVEHDNLYTVIVKIKYFRSTRINIIKGL